MRRPFLLLCALLLCTACSEPPQKELDMAQGAIDAARAAGAEQYASEPFTAATKALENAHAAVEERDYRLALSRALEAREQAHEAAKRAADGKSRARSESEAGIAALRDAIDQLQQKLKTAESARVPAKELTAARRTATAARATLQKAREAMSEGNYLEAGKPLGSTRTEITEQIRTLDAATAARLTRPARRRR